MKWKNTVQSVLSRDSEVQSITNPMQSFKKLVLLSAVVILSAKVLSTMTEIEAPQKELVEREHNKMIFPQVPVTAVNSKTIALPQSNYFNTSVQEHVLVVKKEGPQEDLIVDKISVNPQIGLAYPVRVGDDGVLSLSVSLEKHSLASSGTMEPRQPMKLVFANENKNINYDNGRLQWSNLAPGEYVVALRMTGLDEKGGAIESGKKLKHDHCDRSHADASVEPQVHCALFVTQPILKQDLPLSQWDGIQKHYEQEKSNRSLVLKASDTMSSIPLSAPLLMLLAIWGFNATGALRLINKASYVVGLSNKITVSSPKLR